MKKAIIAIAALLAAAGVSIGAFYAVKNKSEQETAQNEMSQADNVLFNIDSDSINKINISFNDESYTVELLDERWKLTESTNGTFEVNQTVVQGMCTSLSSLTAVSNYGDLTDENKASYGLDSPYILTAYSDDSQYTLYIGNQSPTGDYYYTYTDEKSGIYVISANDSGLLFTTRLGLKDSDLLPYDSNSIVGINLVRDGKTIFDLNYDDEERMWKLPEKYDILTIDQTKIDSALTLLTRLSAEEMFPEGEDDIKDYGFDKPIAELTLKGRDGTSVKLLLSKYGQQSDIYTLVYISESNQVEKYYASDLSFTEKNIFDLTLKSAESASAYAISNFEIISEDLNVKFDLDLNEGWAKTGNSEIDLTNAELKSHFTTFYNTFSYILFDDIDVDSAPELKDPIFTAIYGYDDGTPSIKIDFVPTGKDDLCYVFKNGKYTGSLASDDFIYGTDSVSAAYDVLCRQAGIEQ